MPDYTLNFTTYAKGYGYCSITTVKESTVSLTVANPYFKLNITPRKGSTSDQMIVQVCATYDPPENVHTEAILTNVIYDVEMPSGYQYMEVINQSSTPDIGVR
jgi:hypothetical protein